MTAKLIFLCFLSIVPPLRAGWVASEGPPARIGYSAPSGRGHASFDAALKELSDKGRIQQLDWIAASDLLANDRFQQELLAGLGREAPRELKEAQKSSGNMHNPKMHQLRRPFEKALLATPTVTKLNDSLSTRGLAITGIAIEKFEFTSTEPNTPRRFRGISLWLEVTKVAKDASRAGANRKPEMTLPARPTDGCSGLRMLDGKHPRG